MRPLPLLPSIPVVDDPVGYIARELEWSAAAIERGHDLTVRGLPPLATTTTLAYLFGVSPSFINSMTLRPERYYRTFLIPRRGRAPRRIDAPRVALKIIQRWIHDHVLTRIDLPPAATAYRASGGINANARPHVGRSRFLKVDIADFFPSVRGSEVYRVFETMGFDEAIARQLTQLTVLPTGALPQGAPTSPMLSNALMIDCDTELLAIAADWDASYTRYADDLTFSSDSKYFDARDVEAIAAVLRRRGFELNPRKTHLIGMGHRHVTAGISTTTKVNAPRSSRRRWRAMFHQAQDDPAAFQDRRDELLGIAAFVQTYDPPLAARYRDIALSLPTD